MGVRDSLGGNKRKEKPAEAPATTVPYTPRRTTPAPAAPRTADARFVPGKKNVVLRTDPIRYPNIIAIGSSTGGPQALFRVIKDMGKDLQQPIVITQHMPAAFTSILADHISKQCDVVCTEAREGDILISGRYYVAPGDYHMLIEEKGSGPSVHLVKDPPENFCRPAVDPMLRSLTKIFGSKMLVVILTGMGQDGMKGSQIVVQNGGSVIAQDEATSVVWGMPGAVAMAGLCTQLFPIDKIGGFVRQVATRTGS
jgi:two-component system chemotaxis response regulator CheB